MNEEHLSLITRGPAATRELGQRIGAVGRDDELILQRVDQRDFRRVVRVEQLDTNVDGEILGVLGQFVRARGIDDARTIVIVIEQQHGEIAARGHLRHRDGGALGRVHHGHRVERVLIHPDDRLPVQGRDIAEAEHAVHAACQLRGVVERSVRLSSAVGLLGHLACLDDLIQSLLSFALWTATMGTPR